MLEKSGFLLLGISAVIYIGVLIAAMAMALPGGIIGLLAFGGIFLLFVQAIKDRLANKEDDYYSKNVEK